MFVAEDIRGELEGKASLIGFFSDDIVLVPGAQTGSELAIKSLGFMFTIMDVHHPEPLRVSIALSVNGSEPSPFMAERVMPNPGPGRSANLVGTVAPFTFKEFGVREFLINVNGEVHRTKFEIRSQDSTADESRPKVQAKSRQQAKSATSRKSVARRS